MRAMRDGARMDNHESVGVWHSVHCMIWDRERRLAKCITPSLLFCSQHGSCQSLLLSFDISYSYM